MSVSKNNLDQAIGDARDALDDHDYGHEIPAYVVRNLLDALREAREQAVAWIDMEPDGTITSAPRLYSDGSEVEVPLYTAPPAARGEAVATVQTITSLVGETRKCIIGPAEVIDSLPVGTAVYAAPPAAADEVAKHSTQDCYEHFLAYSGLEDSPWIKYAYFHGADVGLDRSSKPAPAAPAVPAGWREHVEDRIRTWRQSFVNRHGDQLEILDFMGSDSLDDLIDYVCSGQVQPAAAVPEAAALVQKWREQANAALRRSGTWNGNDMADRIERMADELAAMLAAAERPKGVDDAR